MERVTFLIGWTEISGLLKEAWRWIPGIWMRLWEHQMDLLVGVWLYVNIAAVDEILISVLLTGRAWVVLLLLAS